MLLTIDRNNLKNLNHFYNLNKIMKLLVQMRIW